MSRSESSRLLLDLGYTVYSKVRLRITEDNHWRCAYCNDEVTIDFFSGDNLATIDHKIPLSRGGSWKRFNLICACRKCNADKGSMTDAEYILYRRWMGY